MSETYYLTTNTARTTLHVDAECRQLSFATNVREAFDSEIEKYRECKVCAGENDHYVGGEKDHYRSLRDAAQSD